MSADLFLKFNYQKQKLKYSYMQNKKLNFFKECNTIVI